MASSYTTNLGIEKIGSGEQSGTWGGTTNTNWDLVGEAISGLATVNLPATGSSGTPNDVPITDGALSDGRNAFIEFTDSGDLGATAFVRITPDDAEKIVYIRNSLSGSRAINIFQGTYDGAKDYTLAAGKDILLKMNGIGTGSTTEAVFIDLEFINITASGTITAGGYSGLPVADLSTVGIVELATVGQTNTGTDATLAVTPDGLNDWTGGSGAITKLGTIATGTWNADVIVEAKLQNQSGTNTGNETLGTINALAITTVGTVTTGTWNADVIAEAKLQNQSGTNTGNETLSSINALAITTVGTIGTGTWNAGIIAEAKLQNQSGTNTGNETRASVEALAIRVLGTVTALVATTADINNGTAEVVLGGTTPKAASVSKLTLTGEFVEKVFGIPSSTTPELDPADGTIQTWALTGNSTPTDVLAAGESITLRISDGASRTINWTSVLAADQWVGGAAPILATSGFTWVELWHDGTEVKGALIGTTA